VITLLEWLGKIAAAVVVIAIIAAIFIRVLCRPDPEDTWGARARQQARTKGDPRGVVAVEDPTGGEDT